MHGWLAWLACCTWWVLAGLAPAGPARAGALPGELPALVGRLNAVQGELRWYDRDRGEWTSAGAQAPLRNWPVSSGDRLRTGADARAELQIGGSTVRLGERAELWLQRLDGQGVVLHLQSGSLALRLAAVDDDGFGPVELLTREGRWLPLRPGHYRLDRERDATQATAWRGELRFEAHDSALVILPGRRADLWQDPPGTTRVAWAAVDRDGFADWVAREDRLDDAPVSARHVPPGMSGWQDLDRHGDWVEHPDYGQVWAPRGLAPGWRPYQDGRWAWVSPWGWTWIDAAPWGFTPFHFGLWVQWGGRWCWSPGPRHERPRYAPALSGWVTGAHWGVGVQLGDRRPPPPRVVIAPPPPPPRWVLRPLPPRPPVVVLPPSPAVPPPRVWRDERREDRREERRDERRDDRRDGRGDGRPDARPGERREEWREERRDERREHRGDERRGEATPRGVPLLGAAIPAAPVVAPGAELGRGVAPPRRSEPPRLPETPRQAEPGRAAEPGPRMTLPTPVPRAAPQPEDRRERPDRADRADRGDRGERRDRPERADQADRGARIDRGEGRPERPLAR